MADQTPKRLLQLCMLFASLVAAKADEASGPRTLQFTGPGRPLTCINTLQPFGFGISVVREGMAVYADNPFQNGGPDLTVMPDERLRLIRTAGFDCVRVAIDVAVLMSATDDRALDALVAQVLQGIGRRVRAGLKVIADIHPLPKGAHPVPGWSDTDIIDGPQGPKFQRLVYVVSRLASAISNTVAASDVALELFNEPPVPADFARKETWNTQLEAYWREIRRVLPNHTIIVAGMGLAAIDGTFTGVSASGLVALTPASFDGNTAYAFHPYESATFTHQGYPGFFSHVHSLTFPADAYPGGQKQAEKNFEASVRADTTISWLLRQKIIADFVTRRRRSYSFERYWREFGSKETLAARLAAVTKWGDANGLDRRQLMNTEFGVARNREGCTAAAPDQSAANFIKATVENSRAQNIGVITLHEIQGSCFAVADNQPPYQFDEGILSAMGLK